MPLAKADRQIHYMLIRFTRGSLLTMIWIVHAIEDLSHLEHRFLFFSTFCCLVIEDLYLCHLMYFQNMSVWVD